MTFDECKPGVRVFDRWFPRWGDGLIVETTPRRVIIRFTGLIRLQTYDGPHLQFLDPFSEEAYKKSLMKMN